MPQTQTANILHMSPAPTPPSPPAVSPASSPEALVQAELAKIEKSPFGSLNVPGKTIETIDIQSWAQVALVLKRLEAKAEVRMTFMEAAPPADVAKISAEQKEIHKFLSNRHNLTITETASLLVERIAGSWLFEGLQPLAAENLARGWVQGRQFNPRKTECISVSHVYNPETLKAPNKIPDMVAKLTAAPTNPKVIFEVPIDKSDTAAVKIVGAALQNAVAGNSISAACEVWVGDGAVSKPADMQAFNYDDFIKHYDIAKTPSAPIPPGPGGNGTPSTTKKPWKIFAPIRVVGRGLRWLDSKNDAFNAWLKK